MYPMEWRRLLIAAAVAVAVVRADNERFDRLCDAASVCKCNGDVITCVCPRDGQVLSVSHTSIPEEKKQILMKFEVKDCNSLSFVDGAFTTALKLQTVHVTNVLNVTLNSRIFNSLHALVIDNVEELHITNGAFEGVNGLNSIVIMKSHIPMLHTGALQNIPNLQELKLIQVKISKIEQGAIAINKTSLTGTIEIVRCKIKNIEQRGVELGSNGSITLENNEIDRADSNSLRIGVIGSVSIKGNTFHQDVNVGAANILYNNTAHFTNNTLFNVDILNAARLGKTPERQAIYSLDRLVTLHGGNYVNCKCLPPEIPPTEMLKQNMCNNGCNEATVDAFLKNCEKNNRRLPEEILKILCKDAITTPGAPRRNTEAPTSAPHTGHGSSTPKPNNGARENAVLAPLFAMYLFHRIL